MTGHLLRLFRQLRLLDFKVYASRRRASLLLKKLEGKAEFNGYYGTEDFLLSLQASIATGHVTSPITSLAFPSFRSRSELKLEAPKHPKRLGYPRLSEVVVIFFHYKTDLKTLNK